MEKIPLHPPSLGPVHIFTVLWKGSRPGQDRMVVGFKLPVQSVPAYLR
jgi:hypothetical protein